MFKVGVLASTRGTDLQAVINQIEAGNMQGIEVSCVVSNKKNAYALTRARKHGIEAIFIDTKNKNREEYDMELADVFMSKKIDLIVLIGWMRILTPEFVKKFKNRIINVHPSLIPKFSGRDYFGLSVHEAVILAGEKETGMTIHYVDEGVDTGEIILQKTCPVYPDDTPETLKQRVQQLETDWLPKVIKDLAKRRI